jgi:hypothetical protein
MTIFPNNKKRFALLCVLLVSSFAFSQHTSVTVEDAQSITGAKQFASLNNIRMVDCSLTLWAGTDCGAKINAADANLGATYGELWIFSGGTMTTQIVPQSGHTYRFFPGTYNFPTPFVFTSLVDFKVICEPGCKFNNQQTGYTQFGDATLSPLIKVDSGAAIVSPVLSANGNVGATSITIPNCNSISANDEIWIFDTRFAEVNQVVSCSLGTVALQRPLENSYTTARGAQFNKYTWAKNFLIRGVYATGVNGAASSSGAAVIINQGLDGQIENLTVASGAGRCYLSRLGSSRLTAINIRCFNPSDNSIENYITTSHNVVQNCWATNSLAHGIALHGFHETLYNCHSWGNTQNGLQIDSGQFINIVGGEFNSNKQIGIKVAGGTLNTTEATDVTLSGVQVEDNAGDGLNAGSGGNTKINIGGGDFLRNLGANGNIYLNNIQPGSQVAGITAYGATNAGLIVDGTTSGLQITAPNFKAPAGQSANAVDFKVAATGSFANSGLIFPQYAGATPFSNLGTFDCTTVMYIASGGVQAPCMVNSGQWAFNGARLGGINMLLINETSSCLFGTANLDNICGDSGDHFLKYNLNNAGEQHISQAVQITGNYTNATTTFSTVTGMSWSIAASKNYSLACNFVGQGSVTTAGPKFQLTGPAAPTLVKLMVDGGTNATAYANGVATGFSSANATLGTLGAGTTDFIWHVNADVVNGVNAGTLVLQAAANGVGTVTISGGSCQIQ